VCDSIKVRIIRITVLMKERRSSETKIVRNRILMLQSVQYQGEDNQEYNIDAERA
jgi:hypothetical protein